MRESDNQIVSIGSTCAKDYFGFDVCSMLEHGLDYERQIKDMSDEFGWGGGGRDNSMYPRLVALAIRFYHARIPYVSQSSVDEAGSGVSTASRVSFFAYDRDLELKDKMEIDKIIVDSGLTHERVAEELKKIEAYYGALQPANTFEFNLKEQFTEQGTRTGILTFGVYNYYWKTVPKIVDTKPVYEYYPAEEVKDLEVVCKKATGFETMWGFKGIYIFIKDQYQFVLFTSGSFQAKEGDVVLIKKAKILEKSEYRGHKQNKIKATIRGLTNLTEEKQLASAVST